MIERRCDTCQWWYLEKSSPSYGQCRFNPPVVVSKKRVRGVFPVTAREEWCSEHATKESD